MKYYCVIERELKKAEIAAMERFRSYTDGVSFAYLGNNVTVMLDPETVPEQKDPEKLIESAKECMKEALSNHPDFETVKMNDGNLLVFLTYGGIFSFCENTAKNKRDEFGLCMLLRDECLAACERGEIVALAYED